MKKQLLQGLAITVAIGLSAIASAKDPEPKPDQKAPAQAEEEIEDDDSGTINPVEPEFAVTQNGQKVKHSCKDDAPKAVNVIGNNNTVTVDGECTKITITGNGNKVTIEAVGEIVALGDGLTLNYKRGLAGKEPKITKVGERITIVKLKK